MKKLIFFVLILFLAFSCSPKEEKVEKIIVDGISHIMNPENPLKGKVLLEIEKIRKINPYQYEEVGLGGFEFVRDKDGEVILFETNVTEAQRFNHDGEYLGSLVRKGQGPGEFPDFNFFRVYFRNNQIWASGALKMAKFDKNGQFLNERKIGYRPYIFVDENSFIIDDRENTGEGWIGKVTLVNLSSDNEKESSKLDFFQKENTGMIQKKGRGGGGFADPWGVPDIEYAYDPENQKLYVGLNTEYKIYVKNLKGEILYVIEKPYKHVRVGMDDKRKLLPWAKDNDFGKWALSAYPNTLIAFKELKILPNGYLAVYRVSGVQTYEVDVFDSEGRFMYIMEAPQEISLDEVKFYGFGFATTETQEDEFLVYAEYKIKNLPDIFKN